MKRNLLKKKLKNGIQTYGTWITLGHPLIPEILAPAGFDWLAIDMEHSSIGIQEILPMIIAIEAKGVVPLVRVEENNANIIKRVMDAGSYGVIVPNVNNAEQAKAAVDAVKYPPTGKRGVGLYRAQQYGRYFDEYKQWLKNESVVIIQIEHIQAVEQIDDIFSVPHIDAFFVGPYDLSGSMGKPGQYNDPKVAQAIERIINAGKKHKIPAGFHSVPSSVRELKKRQKQGFKFLAYSTDAILLGDIARDSLESIRKR